MGIFLVVVVMRALGFSAFPCWLFLDAIEKRAASEKSEYFRLCTFQLRQVCLEPSGQLEQALAITEKVLLATEGREQGDIR